MTTPRRLRVYRMLFERLPEGEVTAPLDNPDDLGLRSKLGGEPDWVQGEDLPVCPHCKAEMTFVGQIDSLEHDSKHNPNRVNAVHGDQHFMFGDVGMLYVFVCEDCLEAKAVIQCY